MNTTLIRLRDERGISMVLFAMLLVVLVGAVGLTVDMGRLYITRQYLVNSCDASALAGGMELPDQADATLKADECANTNLMTNHTVSFPAADKVRVDGRMTVPLTFARILGFQQTPVSAYAVVLKTGPVSWASDIVVPWGIPQVNYTTGQTVTLKINSHDTSYDGGGNFYPLALQRSLGDGSSGGDVYRDDIMYGFNGQVAVGDVTETEPGNMVGPTTQAVRDRFDRAAANPDWADDNCSSIDYGNPRVVLVPIVTPMANGRTDVTILGFAAFYLLSYHSGQVTGCFTGYTIPNAGGSGPDFGVYTFKLIE
jgi:Flp pilus assembly protein TadG